MDSMADIHPVQAIQSTIGAAGGDPRPLQRASLFNNANDGPAKIIAKVSGVQSILHKQRGHSFPGPCSQQNHRGHSVG